MFRNAPSLDSTLVSKIPPKSRQCLLRKVVIRKIVELWAVLHDVRVRKAVRDRGSINVLDRGALVRQSNIGSSNHLTAVFIPVRAGA